MANSPPHPPNLTLNPPRKRPSINSTADDLTASAKRRKPSTFSTTSSNHPLRQTSFPPPENGGYLASPSFSPSRQTSFSPAASSIADGSTTAPTGTGTGRGGGKRGGRGGRRKGHATDGRSMTGTSAANSNVGSGTGTNAGGAKAPSATGTGDRGPGRQRGHGPEEDAAEEDDEDEGNGLDTVMEGGGERTSAHAKLEREHLRMLLESFTPEQSERYDMWRRVRLPKPVVRRLVNQALSQSVGAGIVTVVGGYMKVFVGELVERAREVQGEWCAARERVAMGAENEVWRGLMDRRTYYAPVGENGEGEGAAVNDQDDGVPDRERKRSIQMMKPQLEVKEMDKGPLTPDHLREALRRYKRDQEGGGTGYQGLSQFGKANTASRMGGKRLFK